MAADSRGRRPRPRGRRRGRLGIWFGIGIAVMLVAEVGSLAVESPHVSGDTLTYNTFLDAVGRGRVQTAQLLDFDSYFVGSYARDDGSPGTYNTPLASKGVSRDELLDKLNKGRVTITIDQQTPKQLMFLLTSVVLPVSAILLLVLYLILSYKQGSGLFAIRSGARRIQPESGGATFADVAGQASAIAELREIGQFLSDPDRFQKVGAAIPKGILLFGPPGCGKTLMARALAAEEGASFFSISGADFVELYVGVGAARVRDLFKEARENAPSIIFIDELDSVGRRRAGGMGAGTGSNAEQEQALNQILTEMDGFSTSDGIIVIGATNRADVLDPALLRPGRFDRSIGLERPDEEGRLQILEVHGRGKPLDPETDLAAVARRAVGLSGADLANVVNEAALLAARAGKEQISQAELDEALDRILRAPERQRRLSMRERGFGRVAPGPRERITFADLAGVDGAVAELTEFRDYLSDPERFEEMGAVVPHGVLLVGPPGCGKTLLARAVAGETNAAFFAVAASEFVEVFVGEGAGRVRDLFAEARSMAPAIIFIDEIDSLGGRRGGSGQGEQDQTLNQVLVELDGFSSRSGVIIMAATNRPDRLDAALVRPGRFDRRVTVQLPDRAGRRAILELHAGNKRLDPAVDLEAMSAWTQGMSGADLANLLNEAALLAARAGDSTITPQHLDHAVERATLGVDSRATRMSEKERRIVAHHEAGHALVKRHVAGAEGVRKITIVGRGGSLGGTWHHDPGETDTHLIPRSAYIERMAVSLGGRVAEELVYGDPTAGASVDLRQATWTARMMVCDFGMSESVGLLTYGEDAGPGGRSQIYSDEMSATIDAEIRRLLQEAHGLAVATLQGERTALDAVADALLERESLTGEEVDSIARRATEGGAAETPTPARESADPARTPGAPVPAGERMAPATGAARRGAPGAL